MLEFTEGVYVDVNEYKSKKFVDIRKWYKDKNRDLKPTTKGISLSKEQWEDFIANLEDIKILVEEKI